MPVSAHFAASLALLLLAAVCYTVALATTSWSRSGEHVFLGIWQVCFRSDLDGVWAYRCLPNTADFSMAGQAFSILAVLCYAVALLLYLAYIAMPALHKSRPATISLCLLAFFVVCLQIMTLIVFGVRMESYLRLVGAKHFDHELPPLTVAWSFIFAIISTVIATIAGICTFLELRNITLEDLLQ